MTVPTDRETLSHLSLEPLQKQLTTSNQGLSKKPETTVSQILVIPSKY